MAGSGSSLQQPMHIRLDVKVPMRDGILLSSDIYRPISGSSFPVLLLRTPYNNQNERYVMWMRRFVECGYAVVMQDCRGRHDSDGDWEPYVYAPKDGYDTQQWIGSQHWCNGNIGTFGISFPGFTQTLTAPLNSPYLKALVPISSQQDNYGFIYVDGVFHLHVTRFILSVAGRTMQSESGSLLNQIELYRRLPLISALDDITDFPFYRNVIRHYAYDDFWKQYGLRDKYEEVEAPAYFMTGWYDALAHEVFKQFRGWRTKAKSEDARRLTRIIVGPWTHQAFGSAMPYGDIDFGANSGIDVEGEHLRWFDSRLKGIDDGIDREPPIKLFVMGENLWRWEHEWPLARTEYTRFYLSSGSRANSLNGDGELKATAPEDELPDHYSYNPEDPVPTTGGQIMYQSYSGPWDRRPVERRDDVLVYTTPPLNHNLEITGPVTMTLYASSSAPDTDFTATLVDVYPDGMSVVLCEGIRRARFRESIEFPTLLEPGEVYEYTIELWETSNVFKIGHCIRLEVSSSNFPRFDRNLNTGHTPGLDADMQIAQQTIYHDAGHPSHVTLPVIP